MLTFKGCPRCKGNICRGRDHYGWYEQCLQCGYLRDPECKLEAQQQLGETQNIREPASAR